MAIIIIAALIATLIAAAAIAYAIISARDNSDVRSYSTAISSALQELADLSAPSRLFTEEEANSFNAKQSPLYDEISAIEAKQKYKLASRATLEKAGIFRFLKEYESIPTLRSSNNSQHALLIEISNAQPAASGALNLLLAENHYFTGSEMKSFKSEFNATFALIQDAASQNILSFLPPEEAESCRQFQNNFEALEEVRDSHNKEFVSNQLRTNRTFFDGVLKYPLDDQQREAIATLEDNTLVVSAAGSGKTSTIVGKVKYLIEKRGVDPTKILLITYTRKAAEEMRKRIGSAGVTCCTFHRLALNIIASSTGTKPSISSPSINPCTYHILLKNDDFVKALNDYCLLYQDLTKDEFSYKTAKEYYADRKKYGIKAALPDMDGEPIYTKSEQEKKLCDFLSRNGVTFKYEETYEYPLADKNFRQYKPDFCIHYTQNDRHLKLYLEHFAINAKNQVPKWFGNATGGWAEANQRYNEEIAWKKVTHNEHGTDLIYTTSQEFTDGTVYDHLLYQLRKRGIPINPVPERTLFERLSEGNSKLESSVLDLLEAFIALMKSNLLSIDELRAKAAAESDSRAIFLIDNIISPYFDEYEAELGRRKEIDFTDMITEATSLCENHQYVADYDYILVDEFQDISKDRYRFLLSLRQSSPLSKIFCVGDDWQSIYRFSGSDMALFYKFSDYFGCTKECKIETTYRFGQPLINESSDFILKNPSQKKKSIRSINAHTDLEFVSYGDGNDEAQTLTSILAAIPDGKSVYIIGRYSFDIDSVINDSVRKVEKGTDVFINLKDKEYKFLTIHEAKGLEADYIILLNCNSGLYGFPSTISDDPVLDLVLSEQDHFEFGEERRLFYVAMTRAKEKSIVLYDSHSPSVFVTEFQNSFSSSSADLCPICGVGHKKVLRTGTASNGIPYTIYVCSNSQAGCPYFERVFDN
jgi:DNA helicase-4